MTPQVPHKYNFNRLTIVPCKKKDNSNKLSDWQANNPSNCIRRRLQFNLPREKGECVQRLILWWYSSFCTFLNQQKAFYRIKSFIKNHFFLCNSSMHNKCDSTRITMFACIFTFQGHGLISSFGIYPIQDISTSCHIGS